MYLCVRMHARMHLFMSAWILSISCILAYMSLWYVFMYTCDVCRWICVWTSEHHVCMSACKQQVRNVCLYLYLMNIHACVTSAGLPVWMCTYTKNGTQTCYLTCSLCLGMRINQHRLWHQSNRSNLGTFNGVTRCTHRLHHKDLQPENQS